MRKLFTCLLLLFFTTSTCLAQSAWNRKKNSGFFKLSETVIVSDQFYDLNGDIVPITTNGVYITNIYGEYGLSDKFTAFIYFPFFFRSVLNEKQFVNSGTTEPGDELNSIGDTNIGISYGLKQNSNFVVSTSLLLGLPIGDPSGGDTGLLQSGDGEFNQMLKVNVGYSFYPKPFYASAGLGFNNRTNDFSDEIHVNAEIGATVLKKLNVAFKIYSRTSLDNGNANPSQTGLFSNNIEYLAYGPEVAYTFGEHLGVSFTWQGAANGRNVLASPSYNFGVFYEF